MPFCEWAQLTVKARKQRDYSEEQRAVLQTELAIARQPQRPQTPARLQLIRARQSQDSLPPRFGSGLAISLITTQRAWLFLEPTFLYSVACAYCR